MEEVFSVRSFHDSTEKTQTTDGILHKDKNTAEKQGLCCHTGYQKDSDKVFFIFICLFRMTTCQACSGIRKVLVIPYIIKVA